MNPDMKRLKLLAAVAVLGIPLAACEEATPPPPVGSIVGTVSIEGTGIDGVSVNLSNGNSTTTAGGGSYRFDNVEGGAYTVTISGYPSDATFDATSAAATISSAGQSVTLNFSGAYIRTASVMGSVTVENMGLPGVTVTLTGVSGATATTDDGGQYAFTGLRMGSYSVEISGFDSDEVGFSSTAASVTVGVGESKIISFDGTYLRTAGIMGRVSVEGEGLEGVTVSLAGGPDNADMTTMTDAAGQYSFAKLRAGAYAVGISGYDTDDFEFEVTSQNVTVALGETANVPFEGVLLRTSGISGRVSVEGIGLEGVMVTLSMADAEDMTAMTDAGGLYAFSGLAAGDYTVAIALSDEQMAAYVFEMTSMEVTVGDDETEIVNFEAEHAATASVTVQLFIDEGTKNDMMDEGEGAFPTPAMLAMVAELGLPLVLPISLAGPGVHDMQSGTAMPDGSVVFSGLKAGSYQVIVTDIPAETLAALPPALGAVLRDYAYGGPATGYPLEVTVGQQAKQYAPIDITHTTVNVAVTLKGGDHRGMGVPGATVDLYADAMGDTKVGSGTTMVNEAGHAYTSIRFSRAGTTGNTVHMGVSTDDYWVDPTAGMQAVMWNPMSPVHPAPDATPPAVLNDANILNLDVDITVSGATITTDYGGGDPLAGWVIGVMSGTDPTALEAVEGDDVPTMLDSAGMASFARTLMPTDLPATYHFGVAPDSVQPNTLDGGEKYMGTPVSYTHTGLSLAGTMDAGMIEVKYTTQTLKVYVHHELDQVHGYTGNVLGGDERMSGMIDVDVRYINDAGRSRAFPATAKIKKSDAKGVVTFTNVPADHNVIAVADEIADSLNVMLIDPDELAAYTDDDGATGGMFGDNGGFSHTVSLCPLMATDPTAQDHGECGSFAFVSTHAVSGLVWKRGVKLSGDDFDVVGQDPTFVPGIEVSLAPVEGKNLAGEAESATTVAKDTRKDKTKGIDETHQFDFDRIAAGVYKLSVPKGWRARMGGKGAEAMLGNALNPLAGDLAIDVTPATATLYGRVNGGDGFPLDSVTVTVNGASAMTDEHGRYIVEGIAPQTRTVNKVKQANKIFVEASRPGFDDADLEILAFAANTVTRQDIDLAGTAESATVSGTVTGFGSNDPVAGVEIRVDGMAPMNKNAKSVRTEPKNNIYVTGADGTYTIKVPAKAAGATSTITAHKDGFTFTPASLALSTPKGSSISGINFQAVANSTINGRVQAPGGGPLSGVEVTATVPGASEATDTDTTGVTGTYSLSVPAGTYEMDFDKDGYTITLPEGTTSMVVTVGLGQTVTFAQMESTKDDSKDATLSALSLSDGTLDPEFASDVDEYTAEVGVDVDTITVTAIATDAGAEVEIDPADADEDTDGHQVMLEAAGEETDISVAVTAADGTTTMEYKVVVSRSDGHQAPSAPTNLEVTPGDQSATLTWRAPRQIGSTAITTYDWEASAPGQLTRSATNAADANVTDGLYTVPVPNLVNGATYTFSVWAVNTKGDPAVNVRGPAATATAKAQPSITLTITDGTGSALGEGIAAGTAGDSVKASVAVSSPSIETITVTVMEVVEDDATAQVNITGGTIVIPAGQLTVTDTAVIKAIDDDLAEGTHNAMVQATATNAIDSDSDGTAGAPLAPTSIEITDNDRAPEAPRNLTVDPGNAQLTLSWIPPDPNSGNAGTSPITKYQYRHSTDTLADTDAWVDVAGGAGARTVTIGNLTNGTAVNVEVRAVSDAGNGTAAPGSGTPTA